MTHSENHICNTITKTETQIHGNEERKPTLMIDPLSQRVVKEEGGQCNQTPAEVKGERSEKDSAMRPLVTTVNTDTVG